MSGQGQEQGNEKNSYFILWLIFLVGFVGYILWVLFAPQLTQAFIYIRYGELYLSQMIIAVLWQLSSKYYPVAYIDTLYQHVQDDFALITGLSSNSISWADAVYLTERIGFYYLIPISIVVVIFGIKFFVNNIGQRFRHKFDMFSLRKQEVANWPQSRIVNKLDLVKEDLENGPWAMSMTPMQYARKYRLFAVQVANREKSEFSKHPGAEFNILVDRKRAEKAFSLQLGRALQGVSNIPVYKQAILAVLIARGSRDTDTAYRLVRQFGHSIADGTLDCTGVEAVLQQHTSNKQFKKILNQHAYEHTFFASLLQWAREDGVLASADFLWVKPVDRRLWFVLNNVGRQTPAVEVAGIFSHWYHEVTLQRPLTMPMVLPAVDALQEALKEILYVPTDEEREEILKQHAALQEAAGGKV